MRHAIHPSAAALPLLVAAVWIGCHPEGKPGGSAGGGRSTASFRSRSITPDDGSATLRHATTTRGPHNTDTRGRHTSPDTGAASAPQAGISSSFSATTSGHTPDAPHLPAALVETAPGDSILLPHQEVVAAHEAERFVNAVGGGNQDPGDPEYARNWDHAQPASDAVLKSKIGWQAFNDLQFSVLKRRNEALRAEASGR